MTCRTTSGLASGMIFWGFSSRVSICSSRLIRTNSAKLTGGASVSASRPVWISVCIRNNRADVTRKAETSAINNRRGADTQGTSGPPTSAAVR